MEVLRVEGLCKRYPGFAVENVGFAVRRGEIMGFIGRNGAGKTTTLKCLLGIARPDEGEARFFGRPFSQHELAVKQRVAFVSGGMDSYAGRRLGAITAAVRPFYPTWDEAAYRRYIRAFELDERKTPAKLSAGMRVKYALALGLSHHAELLILDEPTSGLDPVSRDELLELFLELAREGTAILFSTHITSDLERCAGGITYIRRGRIAASEPLDAFVGRYRLLALGESPIPDAIRPALIGLKPAKRGFTALVAADDVRAAGLGARPADLESVMLHLEREGER